MRLSHTVMIFLCLSLTLAFTAFGSDSVGRKLANVGATCEYDDDCNLAGVFFQFPPLATAEDFALLVGLEHLTDVSISGMNLGSDGLKEIALIRKLKRLNVSESKCTDADLKHLAGALELEELNLSDTSVTDACISTLAAIPNLRWVDLSSTRVSVDGIRRLRQECPQIRVSEWWTYFAGIVGGRGVLDIERATIVFDYVHASKSGGSWSGGSIEVSEPIAAEDEVTTTSSGGGSIGPDSVSAALDYVNGIPTIRVGKHTVEIKNEGRELIVDGQQFRITKKKLRISLSADGVATLID